LIIQVVQDHVEDGFASLGAELACFRRVVGLGMLQEGCCGVEAGDDDD